MSPRGEARAPSIETPLLQIGSARPPQGAERMCIRLGLKRCNPVGASDHWLQRRGAVQLPTGPVPSPDIVDPPQPRAAAAQGRLKNGRGGRGSRQGQQFASLEPTRHVPEDLQIAGGCGHPPLRQRAMALRVNPNRSTSRCVGVECLSPCDGGRSACRAPMSELGLGCVTTLRRGSATDLNHSMVA
jgi:hypothetical protein